MILYLLNKSLQKIEIIDTYISLIWTSRYQEASEFELYFAYENATMFEVGQFLIRDDDDKIMRIDKIQIVTDEEAGDRCIITGKSIEQMLAWRIVWDETELHGDIEESIYRLIDENVINSFSASRKLLGLNCAPLVGYGKTGTFIYHGETLYDAIVSMCQTYDFGFKIDKDLTFKVYQGRDRSYDQSSVPRVIFSYDYDNLVKSTYENDTSNYRNLCLVHGENSQGFYRLVVGENTSGTSRRETFVDAGSVNEDDDYQSIFTSKGLEALAAATVNEIFDCEIQPNYEYKKDYNLGDIVQIENEYGISAKARIIEVIENEDELGYKCMPMLKTLEVSGI